MQKFNLLIQKKPIIEIPVAWVPIYVFKHTKEVPLTPDPTPCCTQAMLKAGPHSFFKQKIKNKNKHPAPPRPEEPHTKGLMRSNE